MVRGVKEMKNKRIRNPLIKRIPKELLDEILNLVDVKLGEEKNSIVYPVDFNKVPSIECLINKYLFAIDSPATSLCNIYTLNNRTIQEIKKWYHFLYNQFINLFN